MNQLSELQFFVLDVSVVLLGLAVLFLSWLVYRLYKQNRQQRLLNEKMEKTIDRILAIEAGAGGGIDGWEMARHERQKGANNKSE